MGFSFPQRSYVTVVRVSTQLSVALLAVPGLSSSDASHLEPRGSHRLSLAEVPMYLNTNWRRARLAGHPLEGSLIAKRSASAATVHECQRAAVGLPGAAILSRTARR